MVANPVTHKFFLKKKKNPNQIYWNLIEQNQNPHRKKLDRASLKHFTNANTSQAQQPMDGNNQRNRRGRRSPARSDLKLNLPFKQTEATSQSATRSVFLASPLCPTAPPISLRPPCSLNLKVFHLSLLVFLSLHLSLSLDFMSNIYPILVFLAFIRCWCFYLYIYIYIWE